MVGECIAEGKGWSRELVPILQGLFSQDDSPTIVEAGTNIAGSLLQMEIALPRARFYCFEPVERFYSVAKQNVEANGWENVTLEKLFLSDREEEVELTINASTASAVVHEYPDQIRTLRTVGSQVAQATTLDTYFPDQRIDFLKIDTDGYETQVIQGGKELMQASQPALYFEFDYPTMIKGGERPEALLQALRELGYDQFLVLANFGEAVGVESSHQKIIDLAAGTPYFVDLFSIHHSSPKAHVLASLARKIGANYTAVPVHVL